MKHLYFIRHGESLHNTLNVVTGHTNSPLTDRGRQQATQAGKAARDAGLVFDVVLSSPLDRAHHTAIEIAVHTKHPVESIILMDQLKERFFGDLEEKSPLHYGITEEMYTTDPFVFDHIPNMEKLVDLQYRAHQVLEHLKSLPHERILIVSHGAIGRALRRAVENAPVTEEGTRQTIKNAELIKLI